MFQSPAARPSIFRRLLLALVLASLPGLSLAELRIGVTVGNLDNYIAYLVRAMQDRAKQVEGGATLQVEDSASDVVRQLGHVENFIAQKVDVLIVNPADTAATRKITQRATAAGIPLVYLNSRPEVESFPAGVVFVGTDERAIGQLQMEYLAKQMGGKGHLAILLGRLAHDDTRKRTAGVKDVLAKYPDIKVVEEQSGDWQREKGLDLMNNWLLGGREIDAVAANNDEMGIGAAMALQRAGRRDIPVGGIDGTPDGLAAIARKQLAVTVLRDPVAMGNGAVDAAVKLAQHQALQGDLWIPVHLVTPDNYQQFQRQ
ncbi:MULTISPECIES: sugar ABC transporter substrate-binding protein [Pseudomonas]|uniref:Sugar ABC transporter substrate-binding protein n=1 Tax=Pseudomonas benzopyrenica TaxID=2993566 RepID=A0ABZ2FTR9_9PSED|nr:MULTISPECIES: sugar ABC transporter substrate-binding protein [unclassified Pseudomonas]KXJ30688.1 rhizopine-binding protein [Pseudomonas sp. HUK17]SEP22207.1 monosaccharide ABC transporter substrate-binding protein, CUT2 family (TC 3.A.1.2.-) [Pseudomonas sp. Snoq117.2]